MIFDRRDIKTQSGKVTGPADLNSKDVFLAGDFWPTVRMYEPAEPRREGSLCPRTQVTVVCLSTHPCAF